MCVDEVAQHANNGTSVQQTVNGTTVSEVKKTMEQPAFGSVIDNNAEMQESRQPQMAPATEN